MSDEGPFWFEIHDDEAVEHALAALTPVDLYRLLTAAEGLIRDMGLDGVGRDHEDLLSESLARTLDGVRSWRNEQTTNGSPGHVAFTWMAVEQRIVADRTPPRSGCGSIVAVEAVDHPVSPSPAAGGLRGRRNGPDRPR